MQGVLMAGPLSSSVILMGLGLTVRTLLPHAYHTTRVTGLNVLYVEAIHSTLIISQQLIYVIGAQQCSLLRAVNTWVTAAWLGGVLRSVTLCSANCCAVPYAIVARAYVRRPSH
jgi:hypothetical protein